MLEQLKLCNLALSNQAEVDFTPGMICITGETGAGKSLVVDALSLVLGAKADANLVRQGQKQMEVSALFSIENNQQAHNLLVSYGFAEEKSKKQSKTQTVALNNTSSQQLSGKSQVNSLSVQTELDSNLTVAIDLTSSSSSLMQESTLTVADSLSHPREDSLLGINALAQNAVVADGQAVGMPSQVQDLTQVASQVDKSQTGEVALDLRLVPTTSHTGNTIITSTGEVQLKLQDLAEQNAVQAVSLDTTSGVEQGAGAASFEAELDEEDNELILRRVVSAEGKSKAYINGHMATLSQLREVSECLVAIHGQHASVRLMDEKHQLEIVDNFGKLKPLVVKVNQAFAQYAALRNNLTQLSEEQKVGAQAYKQDRYELEELKRLDLKEGDYEELEASFDKAMHQAQFMYAVTNLYNLIEGSESNIVSLLRDRLSDLDKVKAYDPHIAALMEGIDTAIMNLYECSAQAEDLMNQDMELSSAELEAKMSKVHELARRFACAPKDLYLMSESLEHKVEQFLSLKDKINALTQEVKDSRQRYEDLCQELTAQRKATAAQLAQQICNRVKSLALPDARFDIVLTRDDVCRPRLNGRDDLCFMFSANLGQELRPLSAVASGGELSRLALIIEVLTASVKSTPTLIFDEVDTGISGRTASAVGSLLKELGQYVQVITVTHLPQVAAKAHTQFVIAKFNENGQVNSTITLLDKEGRIEEISRMIGGSVITETTRKSAYELLNDV